MLHAEPGCKPVDIKIKTRMIGFWMNIVNGKNAKFSKFLYQFLLTEYDNGTYKHKAAKLRILRSALSVKGQGYQLFKKFAIWFNEW